MYEIITWPENYLICLNFNFGTKVQWFTLFYLSLWTSIQIVYIWTHLIIYMKYNYTVNPYILRPLNSGLLEFFLLSKDGRNSKTEEWVQRLSQIMMSNFSFKAFSTVQKIFTVLNTSTNSYIWHYKVMKSHV